MKIFRFNFCAILILSVAESVVAATSYPRVKPDPQAVTAATKWLSVVDAGDYSESYEMFPPRLKLGGEAMEKNWLSFLRQRRAPFGRPVSRTLVKAQFSHTLSGAPDGNYEFLYYKSAFIHKAQATERVILTKESGHWQVSGYQLR